MEFNSTLTGGLFGAIIAVGVGALIVMPAMATQTVLTMVLPSMVVFGLLMFGLGLKHGAYRSTQ